MKNWVTQRQLQGSSGRNKAIISSLKNNFLKKKSFANIASHILVFTLSSHGGKNNLTLWGLQMKTSKKQLQRQTLDHHVGRSWKEDQYNGITRLVCVGRDLKDRPVPTPCNGQGHLPLNRFAPSPIQLGLEHFQERGSVSFHFWSNQTWHKNNGKILFSYDFISISAQPWCKGSHTGHNSPEPFSFC